MKTHIKIDGKKYLVESDDQSYSVMYEHILKFRYPNIVAGFNDDILDKLRNLV